MSDERSFLRRLLSRGRSSEQPAAPPAGAEGGAVVEAKAEPAAPRVQFRRLEHHAPPAPVPEPEGLDDEDWLDEDEPYDEEDEDDGEEPEVDDRSVAGGPHTAVLFDGAERALAFWGAVVGARVAQGIRAWRGPEGRWWIEVEAPASTIAGLARVAGGRPHAGQGEWWHATDAEGEPVGEAVVRLADGELRIERPTGSEVSRGWQREALGTLLGEVSLVPAPIPECTSVSVLAPAALGRLLLHGAHALGLVLRLAPARVQALGGGHERAVLWLRVEGRPGAPLTRAWLRGIVDLPGVVVARPVGSEGRLSCDVCHRVPVPGGALELEIPSDEAWVLAGGEHGSVRVVATGEFVDGGALVVLRERAPRVEPAATAAEPVVLPAPVPVAVERGRAQGRVDALWLSARELEWLRTWLRSWPHGEGMVLVPGERGCLVLDGEGRVSGVPFGLPLQHVGPGALYVEQGLRFRPEMPAAARRELFGDTDREVVVVLEEGVTRAPLEGLVPAWSLWGSMPMVVSESIEPERVRGLKEIASKLAPREGLKVRIGPEGGAGAPEERRALLGRAAQAQARGDLVDAAELYERGGALELAARLYELAARRG